MVDPSLGARYLVTMDAPLDIDAPLASLRALFPGLSMAALARLRGVTKGAIQQAELSGGRIELPTLRETAEALGLEVRISVRTKRAGNPR